MKVIKIVASQLASALLIAERQGAQAVSDMRHYNG